MVHRRAVIVVSHLLTLLFGAVLTTGCRSRSHNNDLAEAIGAIKAGRYDDAVKLLKPMASSGVAGAAVELGNMYVLGLGVPVDDAAGQSWYEVAEREGVAKGKSQFDIALELAAGRGVPKNPHRATEWLQKAAALGNESAKQVVSNPSEMARRGFETDDTAVQR